MAPQRAVAGLREVAHLYRGFAFDVGALGSGPSATAAGRSLAHCAARLLARGKRVAVVEASPQRAAAVASRAKALGFPDEARAWSSGEFVHRSFAAAATAEGEAARAAFPFLAEGRAPKVFEVSSIAKPRRWAEYMARGGPPLADLQRSGAVRTVDSVEQADVCYWDAGDGDEVQWVEAVLELCAEYRVPLLQARRGAAAMRLAAPWAAKGSAEASALHLAKLGGTHLGAGKLAGLSSGLGWADDLAPQDILLISPDIGDVIEAGEEGADVLILLGDMAQSQLHAARSHAEQEKVVERKRMSVSQRVAEDSPAMLQAATNPLLSVFQLPSLLSEAVRKNAEHRAKVQTSAAEARAEEPAPGKEALGETQVAQRTGAQDAPGQSHIRRSDSPQSARQEELAELLREWCAASKVRAPAAIASPPLLWDSTAEDDCPEPTPTAT